MKPCQLDWQKLVFHENICSVIEKLRQQLLVIYLDPLDQKQLYSCHEDMTGKLVGEFTG